MAQLELSPIKPLPDFQDGDPFPTHGSSAPRKPTPLPLLRETFVARPLTLAKPTPLPLLQLLLVGSYRTGHPLLYFVIFPTINARLVEDVGISDLARVGIYSGALEGVAAVVNCAASFPWAFVGDRYGRRPAVIIGSLGAATASILFGFSNDYAVLFVLRALLGLFASAQGALTRVQGVELSDSTNVAQCLVYVSMGFQLGGILAPAIGSVFAKPAQTWPSLFSGGIFDKFPYALPQFLAASVPGLGAIIGIFKLRETKRWDRAVQKKETVRDFLTPRMQYALLVNFVIIGTLGAIWTLEVLLMFTPSSLTGLGLTRGQMAFYLATKPLGIVFFNTFFFSRIVAKHKLGGTLRIFCFAFPTVWLCFLLLSYLTESSWVIKLPLLVCAWAVSVMGDVPCAVLDMAASYRCGHEGQMAKACSSMEIMAQIGFALAGPMCGSLFAYSISTHWIQGRGVWFVMIALSSAIPYLSFKWEDLPSWMDSRDEQEYEPLAS